MCRLRARGSRAHGTRRSRALRSYHLYLSHIACVLSQFYTSLAYASIYGRTYTTLAQLDPILFDHLGRERVP